MGGKLRMIGGWGRSSTEDGWEREKGRKEGSKAEHSTAGKHTHTRLGELVMPPYGQGQRLTLLAHIRFLIDSSLGVHSVLLLLLLLLLGSDRGHLLWVLKRFLL